MSLDDHLAVHGDIALQRGRGHAAEHLIEEIEHAGLRGHGGAGFPAARKLKAVAAARGRPIVVVNAAEGEPASQKDRTLLQTLPHLVIDGGLLCADALGAREVILCVCESERSSHESVARAIEERRHTRGAGRLAELTLVSVPSGYVAGQESALVNHLNGGPGKPTFTPPMPYRAGCQAAPDPHQQRRDPRPHRADSAPRSALVPRARNRRAARIRVDHHLRRARLPRGV